MLPKIAVIVVSYNTRDKTARCLAHLLRRTDLPYRIIVVDNGSSDGSGTMLSQLAKRRPDQVRVIERAENCGYAGAVHEAYSHLAPDEDVVYVNSDLYVPQRWATRLSRHFKWDSRIGAVAPLGTAIGGKQDIAARFGSMPSLSGSPVDSLNTVNALLRNVSQQAETVKTLQGTLLWVRREAHDDVGGLDPLCQLGADDADYSLRLRMNGWKLVVTLDTFVWHDGHASFANLSDGGAKWTRESWDYFNHKWEGQFGEMSWSDLFENEIETQWPPFRRESFPPSS